MPVYDQPTLTYAPDAAESVSMPRPPFGRTVGAFVDFPYRVAGATASVSYRVVAATADEPLPGRGSVALLLDRYLNAYRVADGPQQQAVTQLPTWQRDAAADLDRTLARLDDDRPIPAEFAFLAALDEAAVASFASRAGHLVRDSSTTRRQWIAFVDAEASDAAPHAAHEPLAPMLESADPATNGLVEVDLSLADLRSRVHRGALRGPRGLADASNA